MGEAGVDVPPSAPHTSLYLPVELRPRACRGPAAAAAAAAAAAEPPLGLEDVGVEDGLVHALMPSAKQMLTPPTTSPIRPSVIAAVSAASYRLDSKSVQACCSALRTPLHSRSEALRRRGATDLARVRPSRWARRA